MFATSQYNYRKKINNLLMVFIIFPQFSLFGNIQLLSDFICKKNIMLSNFIKMFYNYYGNGFLTDVMSNVKIILLNGFMLHKCH